MENLLNLLKQYWKETFGDEKLSKIEYEEKSDCFYWIYQPLPGMKLEQGQILDSSTVLSKKFGWIGWLVENDKIDTESYCRITSVERKGEKDVYRDEVDSLLMLLAIQDEPIRFLCDILK